MAIVAQEVLLDLLSPEAGQWLAKQGQRKSYADGALVHNRGDPNPAMGVVISGQVRLFRLRPNGAHTFVSMIQSGAHYGDILLFRGKLRTHDAMAIGTTVVDHYSSDDFTKILKHHEIIQALYKITAIRLGRSLAMADDLRVLPRDAHLAKVLLYQEGMRGDQDWFACVQEDLAGLIGVTPMTLSKSLARLRDEGLIETGYRKIRVIDDAALRNWLSNRLTG